MNKRTSLFLTLSAALAIVQSGISTEAAAQASGKLRVSSEQTVGGFAFPESVAYDPKAKVLYVSEFGSPKLDPTLKDGMGRISKVGLNGKLLEQKFLPAAGGEALNKPKGIWVKGDRLWVTDIDVVWIFDLKTKKGRKAALPGIKFANDPAVADNVLYVSDNRSDQLFKVEPADFLNAKGEPKVTTVFTGVSVFPNGLYPARDGMLLIVGFQAADKPRSIFALGVSGRILLHARHGCDCRVLVVGPRIELEIADVRDKREIGSVHCREHALILALLHPGIGHVADDTEIEGATASGRGAARRDCQCRKQHEPDHQARFFLKKAIVLSHASFAAASL